MMYFFVKGLLYCISLLPFRVLYFFSDILFVLLYSVSRYRRAIVFKNLKNAFPEKSLKERKEIEKKFYKYLGDLVVEIIKTFSISAKTLKKRIVFSNMELVEKSFANKKDILIVPLHKGNLEWYSIFSKFFPKNKISTFYHPLHNPLMNKIIVKLRSRFGVYTLTPSLGFKKLLEWRKEDKDTPNLVCMFADQSPTSDTKWYWTTFFHQEAPFMIGPELIAKKLSMDVYFTDLTRKKRGYYEVIAYPFSFDKAKGSYPLTEAYKNFCEEAIKREAEIFLWTHKRWKHKKA